MLLDDIVADLRRDGHTVAVRADPGDATEIDDVVHDSRQARAGALFCAVPGAVADGHRFADAAVAAGCSALMVERWLELGVPQLRVQATRQAMSTAAAAVHGHPSRRLQVVGITGTNGKTTTTHLLASLLRSAGRSVELIGTLTGAHTTPEATDLQRRLRGWVDARIEIVAAEVSSHALDQGRADATDFAVAAFTNLTPDHLDYHRDMQTYFEAKCRLFDGRATHELVNVDDEWGARLAAQRPAAIPLSMADLQILHSDLAGSRFRWRGHQVELRLPGAMNVANAYMACEIAVLLGTETARVAEAMAEAEPVPGRMERIERGGRTVIVDYSHTPDSIDRAIAALRAGTDGAAITIVFGCGGDRDRAKRPLMGRAAEAADLVVVTSDNPRSEDPRSIIDQAVAGMADPHAAIIEVDRRAAIATAIANTAPGGVVLVAGKGHEATQTIGDRVLDFDDVTVATELLEEMAS